MNLRTLRLTLILAVFVVALLYAQLARGQELSQQYVVIPSGVPAAELSRCTQQNAVYYCALTAAQADDLQGYDDTRVLLVRTYQPLIQR